MRVKTEALVGAQTCHAVGPDPVMRAARRASLLPEPALQAWAGDGGLGGAQTCLAVGRGTVVRAARRTSLLPEHVI